MLRILNQMMHKTIGPSTIETSLVGSEHVQLSIHDTINTKIVNLNAAQLKILIIELQNLHSEIVR